MITADQPLSDEMAKHWLRELDAQNGIEPAHAGSDSSTTPSFVVNQHIRKRDEQERRGEFGFELIVATAILLLFTSLALPLVRVTIQRERELRRDLWMMRDAIDRQKDAAERGAFQIKVGSEGYPPISKLW
jgi:hypothetical protein